MSAKVQEPHIRELEAAIAGLAPGDKVWVLPLFRALAESDGRAAPREVEERIYRYFADKLRPQQWAHVIRTAAIRWARNTLSKLGALAGPRGVWEWTPLGHAYWLRHKEDPLVHPESWPAVSDEEDVGAFDAPPETVEATHREAYQIPLLRVLLNGPLSRQELLAKLVREIDDQLLPGDRRIATKGYPVVRYRAGWTLSQLNKNGEVKNVGHGQWEITDAGKARLDREGREWSIERYRGSHAEVRALKGATRNGMGELEAREPVTVKEEADDEWDLSLWQRGKQSVGDALFTAIDARIRPDLGANVGGKRSGLPRNIILYGPPGTGKTHIATRIAAMLTGEEQPTDDGRYRMVQFHPSYAYEDFIQGLRPDLERSTMRYSIQSGPFLKICDAASEDPERFHVLVIDEINRGDPARIFGEALYALEYRDRPVGLATGAQLVVPPNLVVIGTMNSVDRSVALMDYALRRRFAFIYMAPDLELLRRQFAAAPRVDELIQVVQNVNAWLLRRLGREFVLGHSFFMNPAYPLDRPESLGLIWQLDIEPMLEEYLFHDREGLAEIKRHWLSWTAGLLKDGS
ncbi:McrB family protein [Nannocystis radixulma]|uniref:AAA family ATPase n=1 Tax=Nannocystis radixulma TaxID=2995305 RepID=A0ABT5BEX4_9BACT|nr:AAA family ATPase [Nannocystis radixulma]MDC0672695.1 AAA family ATPase [Nannocystis radixulma]